jgi:4-alpha-glucanotransferase
MPDRFPRSSGILLHPTSLPGPYGIGDLGPAAIAWIDTLASCSQTWWQMLPVGPTGFGDSPYQSYSTFAGNVNLLSPELLVREGLIDNDCLAGLTFPHHRVEYEIVDRFKLSLVRAAWQAFRSGRAAHLRESFEGFQFDRRDWLEDYALFMALKDAHAGQSWFDWPAEFRRHESASNVFRTARAKLADEIGAYQFGQFLFFRQWHDLRRHVRERGVRLIGDIPIFVSPDSADVWANPEQFLLDDTLRPRVVAGVPPDYFSQTGQLWGNPHYDWDAMRAAGYTWWAARLQAALELVDVVRLDHFRGFCAAWHVSAGETTAIRGAWVPGPGVDLFDQLRATLGDLPLIAEDLGEITPDVHALRDTLGLPGMKILQFAFDDPQNKFLPHHYPFHCVVYTGTHDNDTTRGWHATLADTERDLYRRYTARDGADVAWDLIRLAWASVADLAIAPLQDILDLGAEARMNVPGTATGNWRWRMPPEGLTDWARSRLIEMTEVYGRNPIVESRRPRNL